MSAAQPILPSRNSLLYQVNISRTSVKDQLTRAASASYQLNIRETSELSAEYQRNIRGTSVNQLACRSTSVGHQSTIRCVVSGTQSAALEYSQGGPVVPLERQPNADDSRRAALATQLGTASSRISDAPSCDCLKRRLAVRAPNDVREALKVVQLVLDIVSSEQIDVGWLADKLGNATQRSSQGSPQATCSAE